MRKPIQIESRFLRFLAKPLLIIFIAVLTQFSAKAQVVDVQSCICLSNQYNQGDGQFEAVITFTGFTPGVTWYIAENEVDGLYEMASLAPPSNPIPFTTGPAGYTMAEPNPGEYVFNGKHVDGQGWSITLTNGGTGVTDSLSYSLALGTCVYPNPEIQGDLFVCENQSSQYSVAQNIGSSYSWSLGSGGSILPPTDSYEVSVEWEEDNPGPHTLSVTESAGNGCVVADIMEVSIEDTIALACNNNVQVSLNSNCEGNLTADMFLEDPQFENDSYELILETLDGVLLPGNVITPDHIGEVIVVTVLHTCSGNMCWSYMTVEDKIDPEMNCTVDTVACDDSYAPEDIGFPVAYLTDPVPTGPRSYEVQGADLCGPLTLTYHDDTLQNDCSNEFASYVVRRWIATDGAGNSSVCYDTIKTTRAGLEDLVFPTNWDGLPGHNPALIACDPWPKLPNGNPHPDSTGYPSGPLCGNLQVDFTDIEIPICGENSYKVIRKWFVMDWCTSEVIDTNQIIAIMDNDPPIVTTINDVEVTTDEYKCSADIDLPEPTVLFECNSWTYTVGYKLADEFGNPPPDSEPYLTDARVRNNPDGSYTLLDMPLGQTWVKYTVTDACNNSTDAFFEVLVVDSLPPVAICDEHTVVSLNDDGIGYADAISFDDGSWDNCSEVTFQVRRMANECGVTAGEYLDGVEFCCADIGQEVMVELLVTDANGFSNSCMAFVEVQDKRFPHISCPPDITVSCEFFIPDYSIFGTVVTDPDDAQPIVINDPANPNTSGDHVWGYDGIAYDNCGGTVEIIYEEEVINECGVGTITRVFEVSDKQGNSQQCTQVISVVDFDPFYINVNNPFDTKDDIIWPRDYVLHGCLDGDTDPESLPTGFDKPVILDDECSLIAFDYDDVVFQYVDGYCYKIVRTWTVTDWCQFDQTNPFGGGYWQYNQIIMVVDDELPQFTSGCETDPLINQLNDDGCSATINLSATATDDCTEEADLRWNYEIDIDNDGEVDAVGNGNAVSGTYAYGEHSITWYVEDECGNVNSCSRVFIVEDHKKPTPICYEGIVTVPMPTTGSVEIFARSFNICNGCEAGSYDNCTPQEELVFSFSSDVTDVSRVFTCDDIENGILDTIDIEMWVTDLAGNQEFCNSHLILQDNQDICPDADPVLYDIAGMVRTPDDQVIEGVEVTLSNPNPEFPLYSISGSNGYYSFNDVDAYQNYQISAQSNDDPMDGISTLDLVFIQKHLLGLNNLDNAYEIIAADVNGSGSISAADLLDLRKLILGVSDELPNNDSWEFVVAEEDFENNLDPFPLQEDYLIEGLRYHTVQNHFTGIKIGDVNQSIQLNADADLESRWMGSTSLYADNESFNNGDELAMNVFLEDKRQTEGMQFTMVYDDQKLEFVSLQGVQASFNPTNYHAVRAQNGFVTVSWNRSAEAEFNTEEAFFKVLFKAKKAGMLEESVRFSSEITPAEIYFGELDQVETDALELRFRKGEKISDDFVLYQNTPNPFTHETKISYYVPYATEVVLSVYDVDGKLVYEALQEAQSGQREFKLNSENANLSEGIYYYSVKAGKDISTRKMIVIR
jgi:hypothetical protein